MTPREILAFLENHSSFHGCFGASSKLRATTEDCLQIPTTAPYYAPLPVYRPPAHPCFRLFTKTCSAIMTTCDLDDFRQDCKTPFNAHIIAAV